MFDRAPHLDILLRKRLEALFEMQFDAFELGHGDCGELLDVSGVVLEDCDDEGLLGRGYVAFVSLNNLHDPSQLAPHVLVRHPVLLQQIEGRRLGRPCLQQLSDFLQLVGLVGAETL